MELGARIRIGLECKNMNQKQLCEKLKIQQQTFSGYVNDKHQMPYETLAQIAKCLDLTTDYLLGLTDNRMLPLALTESEQNLMIDFRALSKPQKELVAANIKWMKEQNKR